MAKGIKSICRVETPSTVRRVFSRTVAPYSTGTAPTDRVPLSDRQERKIKVINRKTDGLNENEVFISKTEATRVCWPLWHTWFMSVTGWQHVDTTSRTWKKCNFVFHVLLVFVYIRTLPSGVNYLWIVLCCEFASSGLLFSSSLQPGRRATSMEN